MRLFTFLLCLAVSLYLAFFYGSYALYALVLAEFILFIISLISASVIRLSSKIIIEKPHEPMKKNSECYIKILINSPIISGRVKGRIQAKNNLTGRIITKDFSLCGGRKQSTVLPWDITENGKISLNIIRVTTYDISGILKIKLRKDKLSTEFFVIPAAVTSHENMRLEAFNGRFMHCPTTKKSDSYDIRDYRPGDKLSSIHWKQSAKKQRLMVKLPENENPHKLIIFADIQSGEEAEKALDYIAELCLNSIKGGFAVLLYWADRGKLRSCELQSSNDYFAMCKSFILSHFSHNRATVKSVSMIESNENEFYYLNSEGYRKVL